MSPRSGPSRRLAVPLSPRGALWLALFLVALALRVGYTWLATGPHATPYSDPVDYDVIAWNLTTGHGFSLGSDGATYPTAFRPPLVPWITSLLYRVVGHRFFAAVLLQCVIGALVPLLTAALGAALFGMVVGMVAGWLVAVHPTQVFFSGYLLTETTFTAMMILALLATAAWIKSPGAGRALGVGILWGITCLARPTAVLLPVVVAGWAWGPLGLMAPRARVRQIGLLALGVVLAIGPWTLRNAVAMHAFIPITTGGGRAFLDSNNPLIWNDPALRGGAVSVYHLKPYDSQFRGLSEPQADSLAAHLGREFLRAHVSEWPAMAAAKLGRFWRLRSEVAGSGTWRRGGSPLEAIMRLLDPLLVWSAITLPLALWGMWRILVGPRRWFQSLPVFVILYFTALAVVYWGSLRSRVSIDPLVMVLAAVGIDDLGRRLALARRR